MTLKRLSCALGLACVLGAAGAARADTVLWIDDTLNNIGTVDITTHTGTLIGNASIGGTLTDIGFDASGNLYGVNFNNTYLINQTTGHAGAALVSTPSSGMNALVGAQGGGLYGASGTNLRLYFFDTGTNTWTQLTGFTAGGAAGDLAYANGSLYESTVDGVGNDELVRLTIAGGAVTGSTVIGEFSQGGQTFQGVYGLADDGTTMYAVNGTTIYSVNLSNGALTTVFDYGGLICSSNVTCLGAANGTAFINDATGGTGGGGVPEPATWGLMLAGFFGLGTALRARRSTALGSAH